MPRNVSVTNGTLVVKGHTEDDQGLLAGIRLELVLGCSTLVDTISDPTKTSGNCKL